MNHEHFDQSLDDLRTLAQSVRDVFAFVFHKPNECNALDSLFKAPSDECLHNALF